MSTTISDAALLALQDIARTASAHDVSGWNADGRYFYIEGLGWAFEPHPKATGTVIAKHLDCGEHLPWGTHDWKRRDAGEAVDLALMARIRRAAADQEFTMIRVSFSPFELDPQLTFTAGQGFTVRKETRRGLLRHREIATIPVTSF